MAKKKEILTAEKLLTKKHIIEQVNKIFEYDSMFFDSKIVIDRVPAEEIMCIMQNEDKSVYKRQCELVYTSCKCFRNETLIKTLEVSEPYDVVDKIYSQNLWEFNDLVETILSMYGFVNLVADIKK